jgi:hypothetical protein
MTTSWCVVDLRELTETRREEGKVGEREERLITPFERLEDTFIYMRSIGDLPNM